MKDHVRLRWMLGVGATAAGAMYLLDPDRGRRRRAGLTDRARSRAHRVEVLAGKAERDLRNRAKGIAARVNGSPPRRVRRQALSGGTPERRLLEGGAGVLVALWGARRGGLLGAGAELLGACLIARAALWGTSDHTIRVQKTITVAAPIHDVYELWARIENFPRFMDHVLEVRRTSPGHSHWKVSGPAGVPVEWDAEVTEHLPDRSITWRSVPGSGVEHHGEVHFERIEEGITRVSVHMTYRPPGGALAHGVVSFLHGDPKSLMDADLLRMKSLLESGKSTAHGTEVHRDELL